MGLFGGDSKSTASQRQTAQNSSGINSADNVAGLATSLSNVGGNVKVTVNGLTSKEALAINKPIIDALNRLSGAGIGGTSGGTSGSVPPWMIAAVLGCVGVVGFVALKKG